MPDFEYFISGKSLFFVFSLSFGMYVGLFGIGNMVSKRKFLILMILALFLTLLGWWQSAKDEEKATTQETLLSDIKKSVETTAKLFNISPDQPAKVLVDQIAQQVVLLNSKIGELEKKNKSRRLTDVEKENLISMLSTYSSSSPLVLIRQSSETESGIYADEWAEILRKSKWRVDPIRLTLSNSRFEGVTIVAKNSEIKGVMQLNDAFMSVGIKPEFTFHESWGEERVGLNIGPKRAE